MPNKLPPVRKQLFPGEETYFRDNPHVAGMAAEDDNVIINPYSALSEEEFNAVIRNEQARILMRTGRIPAPIFEIMPEQRRSFKGTPYEADEAALRATIAARILTRDPSAGIPTTAQMNYVMQYLQPFFK